jgi:hypothetical protein
MVSETVPSKEEGHAGTNIFEIAFSADSALTVYSFIFVIFFTMVADAALEHLEQSVSAVYHKVLQRLYKELMLLGIISFSLFLIQSSPQKLDKTKAYSFEYAHLVMLFVGVLMVTTSTWTCLCNQQIKKRSIRDTCHKWPMKFI